MTDDRTRRLALHGGEKVCKSPWPERALIGEEEKQAVVALFDEAIASGKPIGYNGPQEEAYCKEFAESLGGGYADAVNSGTSAVYVALRALEIPPFTEVVVSAVTDPGGVMPIPLINCIPVPADAAPGSYNVGPDQIEARITERTSAIVVAHIAGIPADMAPIMEVARGRGLPVIEDCAQAHGARYKGRCVGTFGDVAAFSTMFGKHHSTGPQGGIVFTQREDLYWRTRRAADRGKPFGLEGVKTNVVASLNLNLNEISAAIGRVQLKKLPRIVASRRRFAKALGEGCRSLKSVRLMADPPDAAPSCWFLLFKLDLDRISVDKETFVQALSAEGLPVDATYLHLFTRAEWYKNRAVFARSGYPWASPLYKGDPDAAYPTPNVVATDARHFRMSLHENLGPQQAEDVLAGLKKVETAYLK